MNVSVLTGLLACGLCHAQSLTTLASFTGANGSVPTYSLVQASDGNFYGLTLSNSSNVSTMFKATPEGSISTLYQFPSEVTVSTLGMIQASDGNFYFANWTAAGSYIYKATPTGTVSPLFTFPQDGSLGGVPFAVPVQGSDGNLYGTTLAQGGPGAEGTAFRLSLGGTLTVLHVFANLQGEGYAPGGLVQAGDGNFYGVSAGPAGGGSIFRMTADGAVTPIYSFVAGVAPQDEALTLGTDGALYGITPEGGTNDAGTFFKLTTDGALTVLYNFPAGVGNLFGLILGADGNFYCDSNSTDLSNPGAVFRLTPDGTFSVAHTFDSTDGIWPVGLVSGKDGNLYGTTTLGGADDFGTFYTLGTGSGSNITPSITPGGVISASDFGAYTSIAPGGFIEIYGSNLAGDSRGWTGADFNGVNAPTELDGVSVSIGGQPAFVNYISPLQVNALVPSSVPTGAQSVVVTTSVGASNTNTVNVNPVEPGLLAPPGFIVNGNQYVVAQFLDGTYALPTGALAGLTSRPASAGDIIVIYGAGFGPSTPDVPAGQLVQQAATINANFQLSIGGTPATVLYAGLAPSFTGVCQFNIAVPDVAPGDAVPLTFTLGGTAGAQTLNIPIGN